MEDKSKSQFQTKYTQKFKLLHILLLSGALIIEGIAIIIIIVFQNERRHRDGYSLIMQSKQQPFH